MTTKTLFTALVTFLSVSDFVLGHGGPELSVLERAMHPQELASRQIAANKRHVLARQCASQIEAYTRKRKLARRAALEKRVDWNPYVTTPEVQPVTSSITNTTCVTAPEVTEGPYYLNNDLVRQDLRENQGGILLKLDIGIMDTSTCKPLPNALVEIWHANATGYYSGFGTGSTGGGGGGGGNSTASASGGSPSGAPSGMSMTSGAAPSGSGGGGDGAAGGGSSKINEENFLRGGWQTNDNGIVEFLTVYPGFYTGRTIHTHLMVHQNITYNSNGTYISRSGSLVHIGQMFYDDAFSDKVMAVSPYSNNQNTRSYNSGDSIEAQAQADGYDAVVDTELIGSDISDGVLGYITVGVNSQAVHEVTSHNYYDGLDSVVSSVWTASTSSKSGTRTSTGTAALGSSTGSSAGLRAEIPLMWLKEMITAYWFE